MENDPCVVLVEIHTEKKPRSIGTSQITNANKRNKSEQVWTSER
jgi:hypothetical protein